MNGNLHNDEKCESNTLNNLMFDELLQQLIHPGRGFDVVIYGFALLVVLNCVMVFY